ncbi:hypothetical protein BKA70DRAFT_1451659 [Coprinopsis sp. MPI-PUGE-AT-0042]|nr:hypothetical protein BKA70DRAFT_1451659 [Coprinopsis sp. MPI-PUGE-AT-0042]
MQGATPPNRPTIIQLVNHNTQRKILKRTFSQASLSDPQRMTASTSGSSGSAPIARLLVPGTPGASTGGGAATGSSFGSLFSPKPKRFVEGAPVTLSEPSYELPDLPPAESGLNYASHGSAPAGSLHDPRSPRGDEQSISSPPAHSSPLARLNHHQIANGANHGPSLYTPRTRADVVRGKGRATVSAGSRSPLAGPSQASSVHKIASPQTYVWQAESVVTDGSMYANADLGSTTEDSSSPAQAPPANEPAEPIREFMVWDSDNETDTPNPSFATASALISGSTSISSIESLIDRADNIESPPTVSSGSEIASESSSDSASRARSEHAPVGPLPSFMSRQVVISSSPITPFIGEALRKNFHRSIKPFNPACPPSYPLWVLELCCPGRGISEKQLQEILRYCQKCDKYSYILALDKHRCDAMVCADLSKDGKFNLKTFLTMHYDAVGIKRSQLNEVFVRCGDCDHVVSRKKAEDHVDVCPQRG